MASQEDIDRGIRAIKDQQGQAGRRGNFLNQNVLHRLDARRRALENVVNGCGGCGNCIVKIENAYTVRPGVEHVTVGCEARPERSPIFVGENLLFNPDFKCPGFKKKA